MSEEEYEPKHAVVEPADYDFKAQPVEDVEYNREAREVERARDVYRSKRVSRPSYTRPDPGCSVCGRQQYEQRQTGVDEENIPTYETIDTHADADHEYHGTVRIPNVKPGYDQVTFPIIRKNQISRLEEDDIVSDSGTLWRLQRHLADCKFDLLKQCINDAHHMVSDITASIVIEVSARTLTDKAGAIVKVKDHVTEVPILLPNGDFTFGQH